jgi:hypothetical protein
MLIIQPLRGCIYVRYILNYYINPSGILSASVLDTSKYFNYIAHFGFLMAV